MWGLALYGKVCDDYRRGVGDPPSEVFGRMAKEVLGRARVRLALDATRKEWNGPIDVGVLRDATSEESEPAVEEAGSSG